jgi:hypothetical protein
MEGSTVFSRLVIIQGGPKKVAFLFFWEYICLKMTPSGVILCGESITRILGARKRFPDPDSGRNGFEAKMVILVFLSGNYSSMG